MRAPLWKRHAARLCTGIQPDCTRCPPLCPCPGREPGWPGFARGNSVLGHIRTQRMAEVRFPEEVAPVRRVPISLAHPTHTRLSPRASDSTLAAVVRIYVKVCTMVRAERGPARASALPVLTWNALRAMHVA